MPKALVLLVVAAAVAIGAGLALPASAIKVGSVTLSSASFDNELVAIKSSPMFECYLQARVYVASQGQSQGPTMTGATPQSRSSLAADLWADQRATQLAITPFVQAREPSAFQSPALTTAATRLAQTIEGALGRAFSAQATATTTAFSCPAVVIPGKNTLESGAVILASLPRWFQDVQVRAEAAVLGLVDLLPAANRLPESGPALRAWYTQHASHFDTICIGDIELVSLSQARAVEKKIAHGLSFATAARRYSKDTSTNKKGGANGCFSPNASLWSSVQHFVGSTATHKLAEYPINGAYILFSPTKRTPNRFDEIAVALESENHSVNVTNAGILGSSIQDVTAISVPSWLGTWQLNQLGGEVLPSAEPPSDAVTNPTANTPTG